MEYLLDTNAWIEVLNYPKGILATRLAGTAPSDIALCSALQHSLTVVTHNVAEFSRVPGLTVEDWQGP